MQRFAVFIKCVIASIVLAAMLAALAQGQKHGVSFTTHKANRRVDVFVDGSLFTTFRWDDGLKKPILYPINTARGTAITRGFPIEPRLGESVDHPHQSGLWFNYGDVNGIDFWNNSIYRTADELKHMGTIIHRRVAGMRGGRSSGSLAVKADWLMPDGTTILHETTTFIFYGGVDKRTIDRVTTLTALKQKVVFNDSKEGMFGLRLRRELEQPAKLPILLTDSTLSASKTPVLDNTNVSGEFHSSEGKTGDDVWGTRAKWASLTSRVGGEDITIAMLDDPANVGFPAYWMARGYGLFAVNPLGRKAYESDKQALNFTLEPGRSVKFRYRVLILSRNVPSAAIDTLYQEFTKRVK